MGWKNGGKQLAVGAIRHRWRGKILWRAVLLRTGQAALRVLTRAHKPVGLPLRSVENNMGKHERGKESQPAPSHGRIR